MSDKPFNPFHVDASEAVQDAMRRHMRLDPAEFMVKPPQQHDAVHKPSHYQIMPGVEVKDVRRALLDKIPAGQASYHEITCWDRSWEYLTRMWGKGGLEDARKARVYLDWLIESLESGGEE